MGASYRRDQCGAELAAQTASHLVAVGRQLNSGGYHRGVPSSPSPLLYYAAASVLLLGAPAGGIYLAQQGRREAARRLNAKDTEIKKEALTQAKDLAVLRNEASEAGLDPDVVIAGYEALRDGQVSPDDVIDMVKRNEIGG